MVGFINTLALIVTSNTNNHRIIQSNKEIKDAYPKPGTWQLIHDPQWCVWYLLQPCWSLPWPQWWIQWVLTTMVKSTMTSVVTTVSTYNHVEVYHDLSSDYSEYTQPFWSLPWPQWLWLQWVLTTMLKSTMTSVIVTTVYATMLRFSMTSSEYSEYMQPCWSLPKPQWWLQCGR